MAFDNVVFPYYPMIHGTNKTVTDPVAVSSNGTYEYRVKRTRWERFTWTIPTQTMTNDQKNEVKQFLLARQHGLNSFKFIDRDGVNFVDNLLSPQNAAAGLWNLNVAHDSLNAGTHPVFNAEWASMTADVNGGGSFPVSTTSIVAGQPVVSIPWATQPNDVVKVSGPLHYTVRLASDFSSTIAALDCNNDALGHNTDSITLIEVFGEY